MNEPPKTAQKTEDRVFWGIVTTELPLLRIRLESLDKKLDKVNEGMPELDFKIRNLLFNMSMLQLFVLFVGLKITGAIDWSWYLITIPLWFVDALKAISFIYKKFFR